MTDKPSEPDCKYIRLLVLVIPLVLIGSCNALNYNGFCIPEFRTLSDDEYVRIAAKEWVKFIDRKLVDSNGDGKPDGYRLKEATDERVDQFLAENPDCCEILGGFGGDSFRPPSNLQRFMGKAAVAVKIQSMGRRHGDTDESELTAYRIVSNCGEILEVD